ncbi:MAG: FG-GAP-like repeat-containing protein [Candidatus Neomarinimicrobiota bacterium]
MKVRRFLSPVIVCLIAFFQGVASASVDSQDTIFVEDESLRGTLIQFAGGESAWGFLNEDTIPDLAHTGYSDSLGGTIVSIYFFNGEGEIDTMQSLTAGLISDPAGGFGSIALGDYDNDGDLDILVTGGAAAVLFENDSTGRFVSSVLTHFPFLVYSKGRWIDLDNDGDLDLFIMGLDAIEERLVTKIYLNGPLGTFVADETQILANLANGDAAWGDYDNDGDLDLVVAGQSTDVLSHVIKVFKNEPTGRLVEDPNPKLTGLKAATVSWGDYDNDGDLDLISTGWDGVSPATYIYENEPVGTLSEEKNQISFGVTYGSTNLGDLNNDGNLDMILTGADSVSADAETLLVHTAKVYLGDGDGLFTEIQTIEGAINGSFGDYDGDGDLDLFVNGYAVPGSLNTAYAKIFTNTVEVANEDPSPPASLSSFAVGNKVTLTWSQGSDDRTPKSALVYNVRMGTLANGNAILSGTVPLGVGNIGQGLIKVFRDIPPGTYVWSVQAIDQGLHASEWSTEDTLIIQRLVKSNQSLSGVWFNTASWNDYDNDGNLDLALTGISFALGDTATRLFKNEPPGRLSQDLAQDIRAVWGGSMAWGDYTNDGFLDFVISGLDGLAPATYLYEWVESERKFRLDATQEVSQVWGGNQNSDWADYDNDGDLDLVVGGLDFDSQMILKIFHNDTSSIFMEDTLQNLEPLWPCVNRWIDFDADGFVDLFTSGVSSDSIYFQKIYINDSRGLFVESISQIGEGVKAGAAAWGDFDSDGFPDLAVTGLHDTGELTLKVFNNEDGISLTQVVAFPGVYFGSLDWGDYDNDGDLDLVVSGNSTFFGEIGADPVTHVYRNDTGDDSTAFVQDDSLFLEGAGASTVLWGDYNGDGDLDLLVAGNSSSGDEFSLVYDNLESIENANLPPQAPSGLLALVDTLEATINLEWLQAEDQISPAYGFTRSEGLTYNLQVGNSDGGHEIASGNLSYGLGSRGPGEQAYLRDIDTSPPGVDTVIATFGSGIAARQINLVIRFLETGVYYWRVQAVDNGFARSDWSSTQSFYFGMNNNVAPDVAILHPGRAFPDTIWATQQSFSENVWTGSLVLPDTGFSGEAIEIVIQRARNMAGIDMMPTTFYRSPSKVTRAEGGTVISDDGMVTLQLSPNSVPEDDVVKIRALASSPPDSQGAVPVTRLYRISGETSVLRKPAVLRMVYDTSLVSLSSLPYDPDSLFIGHVSNTDSTVRWAGGTIDTTAGSRRITTWIDTLGLYAVFENRGFQVPAFKALDNLTCQPRIFSPGGGVFDARTNILFDLNENEKVTIRIFNPAGRLKRTVVSGDLMQKGSNAVSWDGMDDEGQVLVSGLYIITVETSRKTGATTVGVLNK